MKEMTFIVPDELQFVGEKFTPGMAWIDLQMQLSDGEKFLSGRDLADRWQWSRDRVCRFLQKLERLALLGHQQGHQQGHLYRLITNDYNDNKATHKATYKATKEIPLSSPSVSLSSFPPTPPITTIPIIPPIIPQENHTKNACVRMREKDEKKNEIKPDFAEEVERLYKLYPTKTETWEGKRSTGKCSKDKLRLARLLETHSIKQIEHAITKYVEDQNGKYLKNFSTFLNNLPDYNEDEDDLMRPLRDDKYAHYQ